MRKVLEITIDDDHRAPHAYRLRQYPVRRALEVRDLILPLLITYNEGMPDGADEAAQERLRRLVDLACGGLELDLILALLEGVTRDDQAIDSEAAFDRVYRGSPGEVLEVLPIALEHQFGWAIRRAVEEAKGPPPPPSTSASRTLEGILKGARVEWDFWTPVVAGHRLEDVEEHWSLRDLIEFNAAYMAKRALDQALIGQWLGAVFGSKD